LEDQFLISAQKIEVPGCSKTFIYDGDSRHLMQMNEKLQMAMVPKSWDKASL
jgi:hypothetical protein